jgi:[acyl-carrier-protein] S-malonyltransferase
VLAILCPGQGSQSPGFLNPWLELPGVPERLAALSDACATDLRTHGTTSDADTIRDTAVAQPLIVAASLIALRALLGDQSPAEVAGVAAGHSVGEITAAAVAGVLDDRGAVSLVTHRARSMARAAALTRTGMSAVIGGTPEDVIAAIMAVGLFPANINGSGQVVAAGALPALAALAESPPERTRVVPLQVAGAFHTPFMQSAHDEFAAFVRNRTAGDPTMPLLSDADGTAYRSPDGAGHGRGQEVLRRLVEQVIVPVRWDLCQQTMVDMGVTGVIELAPAGVLTGLARRGMPGVETVAVTTPTDLEAAEELITRHTIEEAPA